MNFDDAEKTLFKHKAKIKLTAMKAAGQSDDTSTTREGELVITNIRILFVFFDSVEPIIFVWSNISEIKYAKAKPIIGFKTVISQYEDIVVQLIGAAADKSIMEMNKMKSLVDPIVKSKVKGPANGAVLKSESAASHSKAQNILQRNAQRHEHQKQLDQQRKKLLEADKLLYKQFHELVEETKVISENDFWDSHSAYLEEWCSTVATASAVARGKGNYLLADILQKNSDGKMVVSLTPEKKQNIFLMYPEIFHAFEAEVPLRMSEAEFWRRYFENEYYNNSGNISIPMDSKDGQPLGFRPKDDLFTRYATKEDDIKPDPTSSSSSNRGNNMSNLPTHQKRLVGIAHSDVDLTASFADHKESFSSAEVVIEEPLGPGNNDEVLATAAGVALRAAQLATKYNKNSSIVVGQGGGGSASSSSNSSNPFDTSLHELEDIRKPSYIPISLNRGDIIDKKGVLPSAQGHAEANKDDNSNESSAFAVSHRRIKRSVDDLKVIKNEENNFDRNIQQPNAHSNSLQLVLGSLLEVDAEKARKLFHSELTKVKKAVGSAFFGDLGGKRKQEESSGPIDDLTAEDTSKEQIPEQFKQEMLEMYTDITELLRHFYSILRRTGSQAPSCNPAAAAKAEGIVQRLLDDKGSRLEAKKRRIVSETTGVREDVEASLAIVNEMLQLIQQAKISWTIYQSQRES